MQLRIAQLVIYSQLIHRGDVTLMARGYIVLFF